ncbi:MAG: trypsin-like peptidase domain-containing protein [Bacteroidota bacterium]|nr:trypsin-like peptidase domain-containing protein [Bacteroidota bacterium]
MKLRHFLAVLLVSAATFAGGGWMYSNYEHQNNFTANTPVNSSIYKPAKYSDDATNVPSTDFENAAAKASPAVVHIKVLKKMQAQQQGFGFFDNSLPGDDNQDNGDVPNNKNNNGDAQQVASGSGVLVSANGYIVTNNHVVDHADELVVTLNDKNDYKAKVVGTDPSSDLAVIKIEGANFPYLNFANSDNVRVGQWILAIGYPLNLETTVTSGIVSAMARDLGINNRNSKSPIESFIQTDAAVNPGNSGGALVNTDGQLIGINSAIASPTGSYAGYSYAIPSNLVARVTGDIIKYGSAKRAYLGIMFGNDQMSDADRRKINIPDGNGVYVMNVANGSAADEAGIHKGDFITKLNGTVINTGTQLVGKISALRPGDKIDITYVHNGSESTTSATLKGSAGNYPQQQQQQQQQQPDGDQ